MDWRTAVVMEAVVFLGLLASAFVETHGSRLPAPCDNEIYCISRPDSLLHVVQMARLYKDSKTFVDKAVKTSPNLVLQNFQEMMKQTSKNPSQEQVRQFVNENFDPEGSEFEPWQPLDWHTDINVLDQIQDVEYRSFAQYLHQRWKDLGRQIKPDVRINPQKYSLMYMDQPFIVPGGRFREMYYWDSYWTIQGLLVSEMYDTVKGMLQNFVQLIQTVGHIPNGNRIYYTRRTQPPLFISMVEAYYEATKNKSFVRESIAYMAQEFDYWMQNRTISINVKGKTHKLARYNVEVDDPRPESYYEDYLDAQKLQGRQKQKEFYQNMKSGAESGWDYSTRWFFKENGRVPSQDLLDIQTRHIIPVDLNSYLCKNAQILSKFYGLLGQESKAQEYERIFDKFTDSIDQVLWNEEKGAWFDYKITNGKDDEKLNLQFYPSNLAPLWAKCYQPNRLLQKIIPVINYVERLKAFDYPGGVPTSMVKSGQQWDFSNAWPPLQEILVTGLDNSGQPKAQELARELADKWMKNVYASYVQSGKKMFEKYDVEQVGLPGGGGEYEVQEGFGWSNGVILEFLRKYPDLVSPDVDSRNNAAPGSATSLIAACILLMIMAHY